MSDYEVKNVEPIVVSNDIQVRVFTLAQGDVIPCHYHRESADHYFVLQGALTIRTRGPDNRRVITAGERYWVSQEHPASSEMASTSKAARSSAISKARSSILRPGQTRPFTS
jgi:mannose-6-phosphate isomerase-like protein (cupin superfamily)